MPKTMTLSQVMKQLEAQGNEKVRQRYVRDGAGDNVFGVLLGRIRGLAEALGTNHGLGLELWATGNHEARILACMLLDPAAVTEKESRALLEPLSNPILVDELVGRVLVHAPIAEALQVRWMDGSKELPRRAGWRLLAGRIARGLAKDLDVRATLARIERELPPAPYRVKEGINFCLVWIGLHCPRTPGRPSPSASASADGTRDRSRRAARRATRRSGSRARLGRTSASAAPAPHVLGLLSSPAFRSGACTGSFRTTCSTSVTSTS